MATMTLCGEENLDFNLLNSAFKWSQIDWTDVEFDEQIECDGEEYDVIDDIKNIRQLEDITSEPFFEDELGFVELGELEEEIPSVSHDLDENTEYYEYYPEDCAEDDADEGEQYYQHKNPYIAYRKFRNALAESFLSNFDEALDNTIAMELYNNEEHVKKLVKCRIFPKMQADAEMIELRDSLSRVQLEEQFEFEKEKLKIERKTGIKKMTDKMLKDIEDERKQLEAEMILLGAATEPSNASYMPSRKLLRRRAGNYMEELIAQVEKPEPFVPIHQAHWIDHRDISGDLDIFDGILNIKNKPFADRHQSIVAYENRVVVDGKSFSRGHQIVYVKSRSFGTFPALILSLSDISNCITLRSNIKGDPRHITVTFQDLETGKVKISKKPW